MEKKKMFISNSFSFFLTNNKKLWTHSPAGNHGGAPPLRKQPWPNGGGHSGQEQLSHSRPGAVFGWASWNVVHASACRSWQASRARQSTAAATKPRWKN